MKFKYFSIVISLFLAGIFAPIESQAVLKAVSGGAGGGIISLPVPISQGGTGQTTSSGAAAALGQNIINLKTLGLPTGGDDTTAINNAIVAAAAQTPPAAVYAPGGTYNHAKMIIITGIRLYGDGDTTVFRATDSGTSCTGGPCLAIELTGTNPALDHVATTTTFTTPRQTNNESSAVYVNAATGFSVDYTRETGAGSVGIFVYLSSKGKLTHNNVATTLADGIHSTDASTDVIIAHNYVDTPGDDCISVVSYTADSAISARFTINANECKNGATRGITVVGGDSVVVTGNLIYNQTLAALYAGAGSIESAVSNVTFADNVINGAGSPSGTVQAAVEVFGRSGAPATDINIINNTINNSNFTCVQVSDGVDFTQRVSVKGNHCVHGATPQQDFGVYIDDVTDVDIEGNFIVNFGQGIVGGGGNSGSLKVRGNTIYGTNPGGNSNQDNISFFNSGFVNPIITDNTQENGGNTSRYCILLGTQELGPFLANNNCQNTSSNVTSANVTFTSCGTSPSVDTSSTWQSGTITAGSGTLASCQINFPVAYGTYNHCRVTPHSIVAAFAYSYTLSAITITGTSITSDKFDYQCDGY